jgi:NADH:ubiquinone oxidoreductase subunit E
MPTGTKHAGDRRRCCEEYLHEHPGLTREDLFAALGEIQERCGSLDRDVLEVLADFFRVPVAQLYGAVSAYPGFRLT